MFARRYHGEGRATLHRLDSTPEKPVRSRIHSGDEALGRRLHANHALGQPRQHAQGVRHGNVRRGHTRGELRRQARLRHTPALGAFAGRMLYQTRKRFVLAVDLHIYTAIRMICLMGF